MSNQVNKQVNKQANKQAKILIPLAVIAVIAVLAATAWYGLDSGGVHVDIDGEAVDGPLGAVLAVLFGGAGLLIAAVAMLCAAVFVGFLFAGLGLMMVLGLALLAVVLMAALSPLMLPLLIPLCIGWFFWARSRKQRQQTTEHPV